MAALSAPERASSGRREHWGAVPSGPVAYRRRLRVGGPLLALVVPAAALGLAVVAWQLAPEGGAGELVAGAIGWVLAALAMPTAVVVGLPFYGGQGRYLAAIVSSVALWIVLGAVAARRATRSPVATWRDWWREYLWMAGGVWFGVVAGLAGLAYLLTR